MKLQDRRPGSSLAFVDSTTREEVLQVGCDDHGVVRIAYRLYDARGRLAAESHGFVEVNGGVTIHCEGGELLLHVPSEANLPLQYRLYNPSGLLLTWSDGTRTKIYPQLRMEGVPRGWTPPSANGNGAAPAR